MQLQSYDERNALAARIAGTFAASFGVTPRGVHAAKEEVPLRPGMHGLAQGKQRAFLVLGEARLEARLAVALDMEPWGLDRCFKAHKAVEQIDGDLEDCGPDAVRAAGAEGGHSAVLLQDDGRRHHR